MREFVLTDGQFRSLARGAGSADAIALLTDSQMSRRRLFLLAAAASPELSAVLDLVVAIDRQAPAAGRDLLRHPFLETWFTGLTSPATAASVAYLAALAAATAVRAGIPFQLTLVGTGADLVLPGLGVAVGVGEGRLSLEFGGPELTIAGGRRSVCVAAPFTASAESWRPAFLVRLPTVTIEVDDVDPLRGRFSGPPLPTLPADARARLGRTVEAAWAMLTAEQPRHVAVIGAGLRTIVPLRPPADGRQISASSRTCFGAIGLSPTDDVVTVGELLVHEGRHGTFNALLDLVDLCDADGRARYHAPWRPDPRPADALMQGVYAFAGVADFWRVRRRHLTGDAARRADFTFAYWREQVEHGLAELLGSGELTDLGQVFFTELDRVVKGWREESEAAGAAGRSAVAARIAWRLAHHGVDQDHVKAVGRAWLRGERPAPPPEPSIASGPPVEARLSLMVKDAWLAGGAATPDPTARERAVLRGDFAAVLRLPGSPRSTRDWVAVATALALLHHDGSAHRRPELLRAVFDEVARDGPDPDLIALDVWLSGG